MKSLSFRKKKSHPIVVNQGFSCGMILCFPSACSSELIQVSGASGVARQVQPLVLGWAVAALLVPSSGMLVQPHPVLPLLLHTLRAIQNL